MSKKVHDLTRRREAIKGRLIRANTFLEGNQNAYKNELIGRLEGLSAIFNEFLIIQDEVEGAARPEELGIEDDVRLEFETQYYRVQTMYKDKIDSILASQLPNAVPVPTARNDAYGLPKIEIPKFNGTVSQWFSFYDSFKSLVHNDNSMDNVKKLHHLKNALVGPAASILEHLSVTSVNYPVALELLEKRYENKKVIINYYLDQIFGFKPLLNESYSGLSSLMDCVQKNIRAINAMNVPTNQWDVILVYIICSKLDHNTRRLWDMTLKTNDLPKYEDIIKFLESHCYTLSNCSENNLPENNCNSKLPKNKKVSSFVTSEIKEKRNCAICSKSGHPVFKCSEFLALTPQDRFKIIKQKGLCLKCFRKGHSIPNCRFFNCSSCQQPHNVLLHFDTNAPSNVENISAESTVTAHSRTSEGHVLLETAMVKIQNVNGDFEICRALIDPGSQANFITKALSNKLGIKKSKTDIRIAGINNTKSKCAFKISCQISSLVTSFSHVVDCLILDEITCPLPSMPVNISTWNFLNSYSLADPTFNNPGKIDVLLSAKQSNEYSLNENYIPGHGLPSIRNTTFGWVISGGVDTKYLSANIATINSHVSTIDLSNQLRKFWELEDIESPLLEPNNTCENLFKKSLVRLKSGKFQVSLLFDPEKSHLKLGQSKFTAQKRLIQMERRRSNDQLFNNLYCDFIKQYKDLGHMELVPKPELNLSPEKIFYLPHHAVLKSASHTTKLRVVFDGSAKSSSGYSLNDLLVCGPVLQDDIFAHLCRFRCYPIVLLADVEKMYRQVFIAPEDRNYLRILWREAPNEEILEYRLKTVTYGTKSASFLAIRALQQLGIDNSEKFQLASAVIKRDFYVDNLMTGVNTFQEGRALLNELLKVTSDIFPLRQWSSNNFELVADLPSNLKDDSITFTSELSDTISTLGLKWSPVTDCFYFLPNIDKGKISKRALISKISRIFDPLGLLSPILVLAKIFLQSLWLHKLNWDEELNNELKAAWNNIEENINSVHPLTIPRAVSIKVNKKVILFGFCDASKSAYAAVLYLGYINDAREITTSLLCSKSKVAPLKKLTIPRLELCGALLLSKLVNKVVKLLNIDISEAHLWCDSQIVLHWLFSSHIKQPVFVTNRITQIQETLTSVDHSWHHIDSKSNPADMATRGSTFSNLLNNQLWWQGPNIIRDSTALKTVFTGSVPQPIKVNILTTASNNEINFIKNQSNFLKLLKIVAWCYRYVMKLKSAVTKEPSCVNKFGSYLSAREFKWALIYLIRLHQATHFSDEIMLLKSNKNVNIKSRIRSLNPFIDSDNLLRVGGRISQSGLPHDSCHPYILTKDHLTNILIDFEHKKNCHANVQLLRTILLRKFWILSSRSVIKARIYNCLTCLKLKAATSTQLMGELPKSRLSPTRPFTSTGIDYAGPFNVKFGKGRGNKSTKAWICLFVCFTTRAIHLELVSELTVEAFIAALRRFIARRGKPSDIYSDNGRNFIGARSHFDELKYLLQNNEFKSRVHGFLAADFITWHNIPVYTPHMGGLWEAGVKSVKTHLRSLISNTLLSFEEFYTVLTDIEACLNPRPLTEISSDPSDLQPLTPGHFLIGAPLQSLPEQDFLDQNIPPLKRWTLLKKLSQSFWQRWSTEYVSRLQGRCKWKTNSQNLKIGELVLLKNVQLSPLKWPLARVCETHPGKDTLVRVVTLKTKNGLSKHSITQLVRLPFSVESSIQRGEDVQTPN